MNRDIKIEIVKPKGSIGWLVFWIVCMPLVAIIYFFQRRWKDGKE